MSWAEVRAPLFENGELIVQRSLDRLQVQLWVREAGDAFNYITAVSSPENVQFSLLHQGGAELWVGSARFLLPKESTESVRRVVQGEV